jgi:DNA-binding GntR family transcriptional regulator
MSVMGRCELRGEYNRAMTSRSAPVTRPKRSAIRPKRLSSTVYDAIKARILEGTYKPGDWLSVEDLCQEFDVSRQPVMESLRRLAGEWLVTIIPQVGCRVTTYDRTAFHDFLGIFGDTEAQLGALAAERRTDEQLADLDDLLGQLRRHRSHDMEYRELNREFHQVILNMAHSEIIARLCAQMWDLGDFVYGTVVGAHIAEDRARTIEAQARLVDAIRGHNGALARLHMAVWLNGVLASVP